MTGSLGSVRRAGEAMVTDVSEFRETGGHIARVTDRTLGGVKLDLGLVSCHCALTRRSVGPERLLVSRTGFIGDSYDFVGENAKRVTEAACLFGSLLRRPLGSLSHTDEMV